MGLLKLELLFWQVPLNGLQYLWSILRSSYSGNYQINKRRYVYACIPLCILVRNNAFEYSAFPLYVY